VNETVAVGGSFGHVGSGGWDVWPLVGIVLALWVARRLLHIPWGPALFVLVLASGLALPPAIHAWGVIPAAALALLATATVRLARSVRRRHPPESV
jgi:hypothetical protein